MNTKVNLMAELIGNVEEHMERANQYARDNGIDVRLVLDMHTVSGRSYYHYHDYEVEARSTIGEIYD